MSEEVCDEDQIMDIKLALLGLALWENNRYRRNHGLYETKYSQFAVVALGSEHMGGHFAFCGPWACTFFLTRQEAYDAALKWAAEGIERS